MANSLQPSEIYVLGYARTPMGSFLGALKGVSATELGAKAIAGALSRSGVAADQIDRVLFGCVLPAGLGQAPARQAALGAGLSISTPCTTLNKVCGSGMEALIIAADGIKAGTNEVIVAGGMENMSRAPYLLPQHRAGSRIGHGAVVDSMFFDGLEDAYERGRLMGSFGDEVAKRHGFDRASQDAFATESVNRAKSAQDSGAFEREIIAIDTKQSSVRADEQPQKSDPGKIPGLKPAFSREGTITAANASSISDGAAALVLASGRKASAGLAPVARIVGYTTYAGRPADFAEAPVPAVRKLLENIGWSVDHVDLWEINEAFAMVAMIAQKELDIPRAKLNVNGGACALGHPLGASGARIVVTLLAALQERGLKRGVASLCIGGGEATAMAFELV